MSAGPGRCQRHNKMPFGWYVCPKRLPVPCVHIFVACMALVGDEALTLAELVTRSINSALQDQEKFPTSALLIGWKLNQQLFLPAYHNKHCLCPFHQNQSPHVEKRSRCQAGLLHISTAFCGENKLQWNFSQIGVIRGGVTTSENYCCLLLWDLHASRCKIQVQFQVKSKCFK